MSYDQALLEASPEDARSRHAPWGLPEAYYPGASLKVLYQRHWVTGYDTMLKTPLWVTYRLAGVDVEARRKRTQCFRPDPRLSLETGATVCKSYRGSGFDRGHMIASADMTRAERAMVNTYVFSNIAPQYPGFNRSIWRRLEADVRTHAETSGEIYVITGAIFDRNADGLPDPNDMAVRVPVSGDAPRPAIATHFYKVLIRRKGADVNIMAWLLEHRDRYIKGDEKEAVLRRARVPLATIERMSGYRLLPGLTGAAEQAQVR